MERRLRSEKLLTAQIVLGEAAAASAEKAPELQDFAGKTSTPAQEAGGEVKACKINAGLSGADKKKKKKTTSNQVTFAF